MKGIDDFGMWVTYSGVGVWWWIGSFNTSIEKTIEMLVLFLSKKNIRVWILRKGVIFDDNNEESFGSYRAHVRLKSYIGIIFRKYCYYTRKEKEKKEMRKKGP